MQGHGQTHLTSSKLLCVFHALMVMVNDLIVFQKFNFSGH